MKPRIGLTLGDPAGIGPEIILKALSRPAVRSMCDAVVYGDREILNRVSARVFKRKISHIECRDIGAFPAASHKFGIATAAGGRASGQYIEAAVRDVLRKELDAVVTAPINKEAFRMGGWGKKYTGHTEMLAGLTGAKNVALMLVHGSLRAVHVTSHIPLRRVASAVTPARVYETILLTHNGLRKLGFSNPRIAVCGLNPHAGENGLLGDEEKRKILPAIKRARSRKINVVGPLSADTVWPLVRDRDYDAGIAMYHDQGQIPIKLLSFEKSGKGSIVRGVNVTLGLPIVRTSVAHGTAYEVAGKGTASDASLVDAIKLAVRMSTL